MLTLRGNRFCIALLACALCAADTCGVLRRANLSKGRLRFLEETVEGAGDRIMRRNAGEQLAVLLIVLS